MAIWQKTQLPTVMDIVIIIKRLNGGLEELNADGVTETSEEIRPMKIPINTKYRCSYKT